MLFKTAPVGFKTAPVGFKTAAVGFKTTPVGFFDIESAPVGFESTRGLGNSACGL